MLYPYNDRIPSMGTNVVIIGLMDKIQAKKLHKPLFYLPLQAFEKMNKKSAFTVVVK